MSALLVADLSPSFADQMASPGGLIALLVVAGLAAGIVMLVRRGRKTPPRD